jgi:hypothetical protein
MVQLNEWQWGGKKEQKEVRKVPFLDPLIFKMVKNGRDLPRWKANTQRFKKRFDKKIKGGGKDNIAFVQT